EETTMDMSGVTLLGILPNLPDRLTDPDQAATAAHCVHQIAAMLKITSGGDDQQVYAVTSAQPGDGKTSLTLALALSFAASGSPPPPVRPAPRGRAPHRPPRTG